MSHIVCPCGNDVRENNRDIVHIFVSGNLIDRGAEGRAFFGLPHRSGEKAEMRLCGECDHAIISTMGGARRETRRGKMYPSVSIMPKEMERAPHRWP